MAKLKVNNKTESRRSNRKAGWAFYKIMEAHSKKLGKELKALEYRNKEHQRNILCKTLAKYGAADDIEEWTEQGQSTTAVVNQLLNERWSAVQYQLMIMEQKKSIMMWGKSLQPSPSIAAQISRRKRIGMEVESTSSPVTTSPSDLLDDNLAKNEEEAEKTKLVVRNEVSNHRLKGVLGSKSGALDHLRNGNCENRKHHACHANGEASGNVMDKSNLKKYPSNTSDNGESNMTSDYRDFDVVGISKDNEEEVQCDSMEIDDYSEHEGLPIELSNDPSLLLAQARAMEDQKFTELDKPITLGFVLERGSNRPFWGKYVVSSLEIRKLSLLKPLLVFPGMTLSLFDRSCLVVGHVCNNLLQKATKHAKASYKAPSSIGVNPQPETFLNAFNESFEGPHELKPGDIILSINGRPAHMFCTLVAVIEYMKRFRSMCLLVHRAQESPTHHQPNDDASYEFTKACYVSLRKNNILPSLKGSACRRKFFADKAQKHLIQSSNSQLSALEHATNPLFNDENGMPMPYDMGLHEDFEDGLRAQDYLPTINKRNFYRWLASRKKTWRRK